MKNRLGIPTKPKIPLLSTYCRYSRLFLAAVPINLNAIYIPLCLVIPMLPEINKTLVQKVKFDMNSKGYSLINTSQFISKQLWPHKIPNENGNDYYFTKELLPIPWLKRFIIWQQKLLKAALPKEHIRMIGKAISIRNERAKPKEKNAQCWHVDGYYIRSICVNNGDTTEYKDKWGHIHKVPVRWLLFMTCQRMRYMDIPATLHRRPATKRKRSLVVTGWYGHI